MGEKGNNRGLKKNSPDCESASGAPVNENGKLGCPKCLRKTLRNYEFLSSMVLPSRPVVLVLLLVLLALQIWAVDEINSPLSLVV